MIIFDKWESNFELRKFLEFESLPKMRNCSYNNINV